MKRFTIIALLLALIPTFTFAKKKPKKAAVSAIFEHARYVYVEAIGGDVFNPELYPDDRRAIADVEQAIYEWKRYVLTYNRQQADLVFVVRKGRLASAQAAYTRGNFPGRQRGQIPGQQGPGSATSVGAEVGPQDDPLEVCQLEPDGALSNPLWIHTQQDGLDRPGMPLFKQLEDAVDRAYPPAQATQSQKP
jgi:hypothetical protein